jgi:hypothetical protein
VIYTRPMFCNEMGYDLHMVCGSDDQFEFILDPVNPLTYWDRDGGDWQPDRHFYTDRGSQGWLVAKVPGFERNRLGYLFHDSAYEVVEGRGHGLYYRGPADLEFTWRPLTRLQADTLMRDMLLTEGVRPWAARAIYWAVRAFGRRW